MSPTAPRLGQAETRGRQVNRSVPTSPPSLQMRRRSKPSGHGESEEDPPPTAAPTSPAVSSASSLSMTSTGTTSTTTNGGVNPGQSSSGTSGSASGMASTPGSASATASTPNSSSAAAVPTGGLGGTTTNPTINAHPHSFSTGAAVGIAVAGMLLLLLLLFGFFYWKRRQYKRKIATLNDSVLRDPALLPNATVPSYSQAMADSNGRTPDGSSTGHGSGSVLLSTLPGVLEAGPMDMSATSLPQTPEAAAKPGEISAYPPSSYARSNSVVSSPPMSASGLPVTTLGNMSMVNDAAATDQPPPQYQMSQVQWGQPASIAARSLGTGSQPASTAPRSLNTQSTGTSDGMFGGWGTRGM